MDNRLQDAFSHVKADPGLKETTKDFLAKKREQKSRALRPQVIYKTFAAACTILLLVLGIGGYQWAQTPISYVSIDVNPSIELGLNCFERVVSAKAYNSEGEEILQGLSLKGKKYMEAIDSVVKSEAMARYLTREEELVLTVAAKGSQEKAIATGVARCSKMIGKNCHSVSADIKTAASAHDNGMSVGKYNAYLQLSQYDSEVTLDECRHMSMAQIHGLLSEHGHNEGCRNAQQEKTGGGSSHNEHQEKTGEENSHNTQNQNTNGGNSHNAQNQKTDEENSHNTQNQNTNGGNSHNNQQENTGDRGSHNKQQDSMDSGEMGNGGHRRRKHHQ